MTSPNSPTPLQCLRRLALLAFAALASSAFYPGPAKAASERVKNACTSDYLRFCGQYDPDSRQTVTCMTRHQSKLSGTCRQALASEGYQQPRSTASRQR